METYIWTMIFLFTLSGCTKLASLVTQTFSAPGPWATAGDVIVSAGMVTWGLMLIYR